MRRRLFTLAVALSLVLCFILSWFWITGYFVGWRLIIWRTHGISTLQLSGGGIELDDHSFSNHARDEIRFEVSGVPAEVPWTTRNPKPPFGFSLRRNTWDFRYNDIILTAPVWSVVLPTAVLPGIWLLRRHRRKAHAGTPACRSCGYNLTGNTSGTCPECGTPIPPMVEASA